jgi:hypothetical protein
VADTQLQLSVLERAKLFLDLSSAATRMQDKPLSVRLALVALKASEGLNHMPANVPNLTQAMARVRSLVQTKDDVVPFSQEFGSITWEYVDWINDYLGRSSDRRDGEADSLNQLAETGVGLHALFMESRGERASISQLQRFALASGATGRLASALKKTAVALEWHTREADLRQSVIGKQGETYARSRRAQAWRDLAVARQRQASAAGLLKKPQEALQFAAENVRSWRMALSLGLDAERFLLSAIRSYYGDYMAKVDPVAAMVGILAAYRDLSQEDAKKIGIIELKNSGWPGILMGRLARVGRPAAGPPDACDDLAGHPSDPLLPGNGIDFDNMNASAAIEACERASARPGSPKRFGYQLARARNHGNDQMREGFEQLAKQEYPFAFNNLGTGGRSNAERGENFTQFLNRVADCCAKDAAAYLLRQATGPDASKIKDAALTILMAGARVGSPGALEDLARHVGGGVFALVPAKPWPALADATEVAYFFTRLAERVYRTGDSDRRYDRQEDAAGFRRTGEAAQQLRARLATSRAAELDGLAANWQFEQFRSAPDWIVPAAVKAPGQRPRSLDVRAAEELLARRSSDLRIMDWEDTEQGYQFWDQQEDELLDGRWLSHEAEEILRDWVRQARLAATR